MIIDLSMSSERVLALEASTCIIGAGIAGLLAAKRIADAGRKVIVLESGGYRHDSGQSDALNELEETGRLYSTAVTGRARTLGGTSSLWGGRMMPLTDHDMGPRAYLGLDEWPIGKLEIDRYLPEIQTLFGLDDSSFEADLDLPYAIERLSPPDPFIQSRWAKWPTFARRNVANLLGDRLKHDPCVQIWLNATAHQFVVDVDRGCLEAIGARDADGRTLTVRADDFIFAAGTFETTRLLLLLDRSANGRPFEACGVLGRYFTDHLALQVAQLRGSPTALANKIFGYHIGGRTRRSLHLETTALAQAEDVAASGYVCVRPEMSRGSVLQLARSVGNSMQSGTATSLIANCASLTDAGFLGPAFYWWLVRRQMYFGREVKLFLDARIEQVPMFGSRLTLSDALDPFGVPKLHLTWLKSASDERTLRAVVRRAQRFWRDTVLNSVCPLDWEFEPDDPARSLIEYSRDTRHPAGSARMGTHRHNSVVGRDLRCHSVPNVLVASAAAFPSSGSANPTLTIMQLALLAADSVLKPFRNQVRAAIPSADLVAPVAGA